MGIGGGYHRGLWACERTGGVAENSQEAFAGIAIHRVGLRPMSLLPEGGEKTSGQKLGVAGVVLLDVDDFCQGGNNRHHERVGELRQRLKFGKWKEVYLSSADYIGRILSQSEDFEIRVSMERYIQAGGIPRRRTAC